MSDGLIKNKVARYLLLKQDIANLKAAQDLVKAELEPYLNAAELNSRGSQVIEFDSDLDIDGTLYKSLQKVRKESKILNEERITEWLSTKQNSDDEEDIHWDDLISNSDIFVTVKHINQDTLWDWYVNDYITKEELDSFFDVNVTYAFSPTKR